MGAWGTGILEDDTALDFIADLTAMGDPREVMRKAFEEAMSADYIEYEMGHAVLVSAAAIRAAHTGQALEGGEDEDWTEWREGLSRLDFSDLKPLAARACLRVCADQSELCELWAENEELFGEWKSKVTSLAASLSS